MSNSTSSTLGEVALIINRLFGYPVDEVDMETTAEDVNGWDSLSHTMFLLEVEDRFGITFDPYDISKLRCVGDLIQNLEGLRK